MATRTPLCSPPTPFLSSRSSSAKKMLADGPSLTGRIFSALSAQGKSTGKCPLMKTAARVAAESSDLPAIDAAEESAAADYGVVSIHHVGILCENLERSIAFYKDLLGLELNLARPNEKLPYRGAWLWVGSEMIHLMELPNPDPSTGRPEHGGRDRHTCIAIRSVSKLKNIFDAAGISYTLSRSGRPAIFARDPDGNALEFTQV